MGRAGGGGGGGHSFGGGGGHSSGGRIGGSSGRSGGSFGGGRSGGSFGGSSFGGGSHSHHGGYRGPVFINTGGSRRDRDSRSGGSGGSGCLTLFITIVICFIVSIALFGAFSSSGGSGSVTKSTIEREALPKGSVNETGYYTDELDWIKNPTKLTSGMKNFYQETGVQPYVYITDLVNNTHYPKKNDFQIYGEELYQQLFTDEAHILLIFFEYNSNYSTWYVCGTQAKTVIDQEAANILLDYVDKYYYDSSLSEDEMFSKAFDSAADRIMKVEVSPWPYVAGAGAVAVVAVVGFRFWKAKKEQKNKEDEMTKKILETPLESFGDKTVDDLAKKYENSSSSHNQGTPGV